MSKKHDALYQVKLWPKNQRRLQAIKDKHAVIQSVTMLTNLVLAFSLHRFENQSDWLSFSNEEMEGE